MQELLIQIEGTNHAQPVIRFDTGNNSLDLRLMTLCKVFIEDYCMYTHGNFKFKEPSEFNNSKGEVGMLRKDLNKLYQLLLEKGMSHKELQEVLWE